MRVRWRNHKSHIKKGVNSCEIATHFHKLSDSLHKLDKTNQNVFTSQLSDHLEVLLIESVEPKLGTSMKKLLEDRETYWKGALKAFNLFGGINKR